MIEDNLYSSLFKKYGLTMTKKELAENLKCGLSTLDFYMSKGYNIPEYIKLGSGKNSKVIFPIKNVVSFLENTTKAL